MGCKASFSRDCAEADFEVAKISLFESKVVVEAPIKRVTEGEWKSSRYVYVELVDSLDVRCAFKKACGGKEMRVVGSFTLQCYDLSVGPFFIVITPGTFKYERVIVTPKLAAVEISAKKLPKVSASGSRVEIEV